MSQSVANIQDKKEFIGQPLSSLQMRYFSIASLFPILIPKLSYVQGVTLQEHHRSEFGHSSSSEA